MQNKGLNWKSLLNQQPEASSVAKRNRSTTGQQTPRTPCTPNLQTEGTSPYSHAAVPFLFLKTHAPCNVDQESKPPSDQPCDTLLEKLAQARQKAASLIAKSTQQRDFSTTAPTSLAAQQLLQEPLPAPEHVQQTSSCWYDKGPVSSSQRPVSSGAGTSYSRSQGFSAAEESSLLDAGGTQGPSQQRLGGQSSMHTSVTGGTAGTSMVSTAHSPGQQWQNALVRLRQLQQQTKEAFVEG